MPTEEELKGIRQDMETKKNRYSCLKANYDSLKSEFSSEASKHAHTEDTHNQAYNACMCLYT